VGVLNLATNVPPLTKAARPKGWDTHNKLRVDATRHLVAAARSAGVQRFVKESITFVYRDAGDSWIDETAPLLDAPGLLAPTIEGEDAALEFASDTTVATVLRFGLFYGGIRNRGTDDALRLAKFGRSFVAGAATAYMSSIHCDDVATAVIAALGAESGIYNVTDDTPVTRGDYLAAFASAFGVKTPKPTPAKIVKLAGGSAAAALIASQRVTNAKFRAATGWSPRYPDVRGGFAAEATARKEGHQ
jgi:nucleoside-diphosphate-sugar epimerase